MRSEPNIVAFAGRKGSGKDTAAKVFEEKGYIHLKMAGGLKCMLHALLAYQGVDDSVAIRMIEGDLKEVPTEFLGGHTPRYAMQKLGDEWGRQLMGPDFWVNIFLHAADEHEDVIVSDVRYPNEVQAIQETGGSVFRIERAGVDKSDTHASEAEIDDLPVDDVLRNDAESATAFARQVELILGPAHNCINV